MAAAGNTAGVSLTAPLASRDSCVRVDVYRNGENGSTPLPTLFGPLLGITSQGVKATATAIAGNGNATNCLRPMAFADDWNEISPPLTPISTIQALQRAGRRGAGQPRHLCRAERDPSREHAVHSTDLGERRIWNATAPPLTAPITDGLVLELDLGGGPANFYSNLTTCAGPVVELGQTLPVFPTRTGFAAAGLLYLYTSPSEDPTATWNEGYNRIDNSCAPGMRGHQPAPNPGGALRSRPFQLGRATSNWTQAAVGCPTNSPCITVTNIVGYFVHGAGRSLTGRTAIF